ncbi:MAG: DUF1287 domain-containing protein [Pseudomonadota bacterium]
MTTRRTVLSGLVALPLATPQLASVDLRSPAHRLIDAARQQIGVTTQYDPAYVGLDYPGGDVPIGRGVCTDVVIRALRRAFEFDLQKAIHEDMSAAFDAYPGIWGLSRPDRNIDHRRVPNLETFFRRMDTERDLTDAQPGDLLTCRVPRNLPHIAVVSNRRARDGTWAAIHNIGRGTQETALIGRFEAERLFRFIPAQI